MKFSARYKNGFREGYNNPNQHKNIDLNRISKTNDSINGLISGVLARRSDIANGITGFIWSDKDLNEKIR